jgi:3D (Asp-Asp-Asp) domain-containing protein
VVRPKQIIIHHTAIDTAEQLETIERQHTARGYHESENGHHVAYHFFIGTDGTIVQMRSTHDRSGHTLNQPVNLASVAIALAGNFTDKMPNDRQLEALRETIENVRIMYGDLPVSGHRHHSATACPGTLLVDWLAEHYGKDFSSEPLKSPYGMTVSVSRYYTPVRGQPYYYRDSYEADFVVNCHGDCFSMASGVRLEDKEPMTVAACPKTYAFGTKLDIEGIGIVTCLDRGGAIISKEECAKRGGENCHDRIDVWAGSGHEAVDLIRSTVGGVRRARVL